MSILEVVVASEPNGLRLADLPDMVGAPKSTIHGLARGLVATGYVREQGGRYYEGPALAMLGGGRHHNEATYHHALEQLSAAQHETAILATLAVVVLIRFVGLFFGSVSRGETSLGWLPSDLAVATGVVKANTVAPL